jgi:hypothetical protein
LKAIKGSAEWQTVTFALQDFLPIDPRTKQPLENWRCLTELGLGGKAEVHKDGRKIKLGGNPWKEPREFRNLRWVGGRRAADTSGAGKGALTPGQLEAQIRDAIKESTDREKRERDKP